MKTSKLRVILDTNVLLVSIRPTHKHHWLAEAIINERFTLLVSNEIVEEYLEGLTERYGIEFTDILINPLIFSANVEFISPTYRFLLIKDDPDDDKFVDCAIAGNADFIVTHDKHFNILKDIPFPKVETLRIDEFKEILDNLEKEAV
jgi:uncharacterized protein